jgi:tetratricopeptide (TPR) repeat protein
MIGNACHFGLRLAGTASLAVVAIAWGCGRDASTGQSPSSASPAAPAQVESAVSHDQIEKSLAAAQEYLNASDALKAQAILVTLIDRAPREVRARELYGQCLTIQAEQADRKRDAEMAMRFRQQAYEQYKSAIEIDSVSAGLQHSAGMMAIAAGNNDAAIEHFLSASKIDPRNSQHPLFAAQLLIAAKRFDEAQSALDRVVEIDPDEPIAHASLAIIALERAQFDVALREIAVARKAEPGNVDLRAQEAKIHRRKGDSKRSLELLLGLSPAERGKEVVAFEIAAAYGELGEHIKAARAWDHSFNLNPLSPRAWFAAAQAGQALLRAGEREQAVLWLQQAQLSGPDRPEVIALRDALGR